ncbi:MAG: ABC transporter ATP-binding protein [Methylacidiphilales bacterium]|nr:ABC transporter ATP-binding protein [Candidatus Methylacidiphilales bacterium]
MPVLSVTNLAKNYGSLAALDGLDLSVEAGQVFGLLGPNGSGKTTLLAILLDVIHSSRGSFAWFDGQEGQNARKRIGGLLETPNFYPYLNADQNLSIVASIKRAPNPQIDSLLELVQLKERRGSAYKTYSLGMKQRLALAACLVGDPDVLILDEPTNGLDPEGMIEVRHIIQKIAAQGKTIILASHILDEVEKICSHVAIIKKGKLLASGAVGSILSDQPTVEAGASDIEKLFQLLSKTPFVKKITRKDQRLYLELEPGRQPGELNRLAFEQGIVLDHLVSKRQSLEVEFLEITRK